MVTTWEQRRLTSKEQDGNLGSNETNLFMLMLTLVHTLSKLVTLYT
jgi:hypothetical protein